MNPLGSDLQIYIVFQKICFADTIWSKVFKRFVSWIQFRDMFSKDSFRGFDSEVQNSQKIRFVLILRDSTMNPATLSVL